MNYKTAINNKLYSAEDLNDDSLRVILELYKKIWKAGKIADRKLAVVLQLSSVQFTFSYICIWYILSLGPLQKPNKQQW